MEFLSHIIYYSYLKSRKFCFASFKQLQIDAIHFFILDSIVHNCAPFWLDNKLANFKDVQ
jgi:hypothetical protein